MAESTITILILIAGVLLVFNGLAPIISRKYFKKVSKDLWENDNHAWSKKEVYIYNRYISQIWPLAMGPLLIGYALYKIFLN